MALVYLGLGSNMGDKEHLMEQAVSLLAMKVGIITALSPVYECEPWGFESNDNFLNQALAIETALSPIDLLKKCKEIEKQLGRRKAESNEYESRTIDIDVLFYGDKVIQNEEINIPHRQIEKRLFVLLPMNDIAPEYQHPVLKESISNLTKSCTDNSWIKKIDVK